MRVLRLVTVGTVVLIASGALPAPGASQTDADGTTPFNPALVTFYGHVFRTGVGGPMPANTEFPRGEANLGLGAFDWCTPAARASLGELVIPGEDCDADPNNKLVLFSTAGFVDVKNSQEFESAGAYGLLHNERGQTKDILLDQSGGISARIFLTVDFHSWVVNGGPPSQCPSGVHPPDVPCLYPYWGWDPGVQKDFVVKATLYSAKVGEHAANASDAPPIGDALAAGAATLIAEGQAGPADVMNGIPGAPTALQIDIDLGRPQVPVIPREDDFFLVYSFYSETGGNKYGIHSWRIWAGEFFPPSFTLPTLNPIEVERVIPQFAHGKLAILGVINTPWGSYDVAPDGVTMQVTGPGGREIVPEHVQRFGKFSVGHGGHYVPVNFTWVWNHNADRLEPGVYTVTVTALNYQKSASAGCTATFELKAPSSDRGLPRPGPVTEGVCGTQTAPADLLEQIRSGAGGGGG